MKGDGRSNTKNAVVSLNWTKPVIIIIVVCPDEATVIAYKTIATHNM